MLEETIFFLRPRLFSLYDSESKFLFKKNISLYAQAPFTWADTRLKRLKILDSKDITHHSSFPFLCALPSKCRNFHTCKGQS